MINPFKKSPKLKSTTDHLVQAGDDAIMAMIKACTLYGCTLDDFITRRQVRDDTLDIELKIHKDADQGELERLYETLGQDLHALGIYELNFHVTLTDDRVPGQAVPDGRTAPNKAVQTHNPANPNQSPPGSTQSPASNIRQSQLTPHPRIRHIIVVASGKGGVGKSTTAVNIALALKALGKRVGILDADIYGPSVPDMLGVAGQKPMVENDQFVPIDAYGLAMLSIGSLIDSDVTPVAWRGIKATGALMQLYNQTNWPQLDYLVIDMPPGTGDIQLSLAQKIPVTGAVIVTTPQHIALLDAQKGIEMFYKTDIPVLGVVENMALHTCGNCGHTEAIFGEQGGCELAERYQVPLLGQLPLAMPIRRQMDIGLPSVLIGDDYAPYYVSIAQNIDRSIKDFDKGGGTRIF